MKKVILSVLALAISGVLTVSAQEGKKAEPKKEEKKEAKEMKKEEKKEMKKEEKKADKPK